MMANDLDGLLQTNMADPLDPKDVSQILSSRPWVKIDGIFNARDVGEAADTTLRSGYVYRSATLEFMTERGQQDVVDLGVKTIFDLRSANEISSFPDPVIANIENVSANTDTDVSTAGQAKYSSLVDIYIHMLETHKAVWTKILTHIRDRPDDPFLLHCTGGKDRTGVAAVLVLGVAQIPAETIAREYALTRVGIEPARQILMHKLTGGKQVDLHDPHIQWVSRADADVARSFLQHIDKSCGGIEQFVRDILGFNDSDLEKMRQNLRP